MALHRIRLELARCADYPEGSSTHGYDFVAPLDVLGHFNSAEWKKTPGECVIRRFWGTEADERGHLVHHRGGRWAFAYGINADDNDEPIFRFDRHVFRQGEYVSITEHDGVQRTFRVASVQRLRP